MNPSNITLGYEGLNTLLDVSNTVRLSQPVRVYFHRWGVEGIIRNDSKLYDALREFLATYYLPLERGREPKELRGLGFFEAYSEVKKKNGKKRTYYIIEWSSRKFLIYIRSTSLDPSSRADITIEVLGVSEEPLKIQVKKMETRSYTYTWIQVIGSGSFDDVRDLARAVLSFILKMFKLELDLDSILWAPLWAEIFILYENSLQAEENIKRTIINSWRLWGLKSRSRLGDVIIGLGKENNREAISWVSAPLRVDYLSMFVKSYKKVGWRDGSNSYNKLELRISFKKSRTGENIPWGVALEAGASFLASLVAFSRVKTYEPPMGFYNLKYVEAQPRVDIIKSLTVIEIRGDRKELNSLLVDKYKAQLDEIALALLEEVASKGVISSLDLVRFSEEREFIIRGKLTNPSLATVKRRMEKLEKLGLITKWRGGGSKETKNIWYYAFNAGASFRDILESWKVKRAKKKKVKGDFERVKAYLLSRGYSKARAEKASLIYVLIANGGARSSKAVLKLLNKTGIEIKERMVREYIKDLVRFGLIEARESYRKGKKGKRVKHVFYYAYPLPNGEDKAPYVGSSKPSKEVGSHEG